MLQKSGGQLKGSGGKGCRSTSCPQKEPFAFYIVKKILNPKNQVSTRGLSMCFPPVVLELFKKTDFVLDL